MRPAVLIIMLLAFRVANAPVLAQPWQPPSDAERCPSKWGAGDQRGAANHMKPERVLRTARLIRTGEVFELGHVLSQAIRKGRMRLTVTGSSAGAVR